MQPTFSPGDKVLVNRFVYWFKKPEVGDIVAVKDPRDGKVLIKRITKIQNNRYFVTGDNSGHSTDSRVFGTIGRREIIGKVMQHK